MTEVLPGKVFEMKFQWYEESNHKKTRGEQVENHPGIRSECGVFEGHSEDSGAGAVCRGTTSMGEVIEVATGLILKSCEGQPKRYGFHSKV